MADFEQLWEELGPDILAKPELDEPRLEFAARLDDERVRRRREGQPFPQAEFIYLQLKLARMSPDHPEWFRIATRVRSLLIDHEELWTPEAFRTPGILNVTFYRGFVAKVTISASYLMERARLLFHTAPIEHLDLVDVDSEENFLRLTSRLVNAEVITRVRSLGLDSQRISHAETLNLGVWSGLRWLSLRYNNLDAENVRLLLKSAPLQLRSIDLYGNSGDPAPRFSFDQGVVISSELPPAEEDLPHDWRTERLAVAGREIHPDRFAMAFERAAKQVDLQ
jgi:hypothetical protein